MTETHSSYSAVGRDATASHRANPSGNLVPRDWISLAAYDKLTQKGGQRTTYSSTISSLTLLAVFRILTDRQR
jgi:hypothetical protein